MITHVHVAGYRSIRELRLDLGQTNVVLGPNGLAALYAGTPMYTLRGAGRAAGGNADDDALLDAVFASRCYLSDSF